MERRTRNDKYNRTYYLHTIETVDNNNVLTNQINPVGIPFNATLLGERTKNSIDPMSGRVIMSAQVEIIETKSQIEFQYGWKVTEQKEPNENDFSTIIEAKSTLLNTRGGKRNVNELKVWKLTLS